MGLLVETVRKLKKTGPATHPLLLLAEEIIPDFVYDGVQQIFIDSAIRFKNFTILHGRLPKYDGPEADEKQCYSFMQRVRQARQEGDADYLTAERRAII
jgi:hypothetical protein